MSIIIDFDFDLLKIKHVKCNVVRYTHKNIAIDGSTVFDHFMLSVGKDGNL